MNLRLLTALLGLILMAVPRLGSAQEPAAAEQTTAVTPESELHALIDRINAKITAGAQSPADFTKEAADFDALVAKYKSTKSESVARIAYMQASFYLKIMEDAARTTEVLKMIIKDLPDTEAAAAAEQALSSIASMAEAEAKQAALIGKPAPELHFTWSTREGLKTLADLKGQVVVLDFWATWCGPCLSSFPQVREHVTHFKNSPVAIIGVTSLQGFVANLGPKIDTQGNPKKEMSLMTDFIKAKDITWDITFSEESVFNPDYLINSIPFLAIIAPDGTLRHAGLHPGDPSADITGKITALLKEFNLPVPN